MAENHLFAVPTAWPGGIQAAPVSDLVLCHCFTVLAVRRRAIQHVMILPNPDSCADGCYRRIQVLKSFGVGTLAIGDIGCWPLQQLQDAGIDVVRHGQNTVRGTLHSFLQGELEPHETGGDCHQPPVHDQQTFCPKRRCAEPVQCPCPHFRNPGN